MPCVRALSSVVVLCLALLTGCGSGGKKSPTSAAPKSSSAAGFAAPSGNVKAADLTGCAQLPPGDLVTFATGAEQPAFAIYHKGTGDQAVIFVNQSGGNVCEWTDVAKKAADSGDTVLAIVGDEGEVDGMVAAAKFLRTERPNLAIHLAGASLGGAAVVAAASSIKPAVSSVVALSPVGTTNEGENAIADAAKVSAPTLVIVGDQDEFGAAEAAPQLASGIRGAKLVTLKTDEHGTALLVGAHAKEVISAVNEYLAK